MSDSATFPSQEPKAAPRLDLSRPTVVAILAMSLDGKISDAARQAARFPSATDQQHLEQQLAWSDAALFGAGTLRAYGTSLRIKDTDLLAQRRRRQLQPQPIHIVCSRSGKIEPELAFFKQPLPRWLLTDATSQPRARGFEQILTAPTGPDGFDWVAILRKLKQIGIEKLLVMGGGQLVAALAQQDLIDELRLTVCPLLLGGQKAPTVCDGKGFSVEQAPWFELVSAQPVDSEVFLHYRHRGRPPI